MARDRKYFLRTLFHSFPGLNRLAVIGASEEDLEAIRKCLKSRWPYPTTVDGRVEEGPIDGEDKEEGNNKKNKEEGEDKKKEEGEEEKKDEEKKEEGDKKEEEEGKKDDKEGENETKGKEEDDGSNEDDGKKKAEAKDDKALWQFKVKRYPWAVSYGNKHLDKLVDAVKVAASEVGAGRQTSLPDIPEPANMDAESAKSVLAFLLKVRITFRKRLLHNVLN